MVELQAMYVLIRLMTLVDSIRPCTMLCWCSSFAWSKDLHCLEIVGVIVMLVGVVAEDLGLVEVAEQHKRRVLLISSESNGFELKGRQRKSMLVLMLITPPPWCRWWRPETTTTSTTPSGGLWTTFQLSRFLVSILKNKNKNKN